MALLHQRDSVCSSSFPSERSLRSGLGNRQFHFVPLEAAPPHFLISQEGWGSLQASSSIVTKFPSS